MEKIFDAYQLVGKFATLFDGMMTSSNFLSRLILRFFWGLDSTKYEKFLAQAFEGIPKNFSGRLLEVPVGTGVLSLPIYKEFDRAEIFCLDYSPNMLDTAKRHAADLALDKINFMLGNVSNLPFDDDFFDCLLSINGFHVFDDKPAAYSETFRVLKSGGIFCGCMYVAGQNRRTDFLVRNFFARQGFFTPPFETPETLSERLGKLYSRVKISQTGSFAGFVCVK